VKVKQRLSVSKRQAQKFETGGFNFKKLNHVEAEEQYQVKMSNWFAALEKTG
jgi:hypothetical protein